MDASDLVTACASGPVRQLAGERALLQAGISVPVFAMTEKGKELIIEKIRQSGEQVLIKQAKLPATGGNMPDRWCRGLVYSFF